MFVFFVDVACIAKDIKSCDLGINVSKEKKIIQHPMNHDILVGEKARGYCTSIINPRNQSYLSSLYDPKNQVVFYCSIVLLLLRCGFTKLRCGIFCSANLNPLNVFVTFPLNNSFTLNKTSPGRRRAAKDVAVGHLSMWDLTSVGLYVDVARVLWWQVEEFLYKWMY